MNTAKKILQGIDTDQEGFLVSATDWNKEVSLIMSQNLGIKKLTADHWKVINALRLHYQKFGVAPAIHNICHNHHQHDNWVHELFINCLNAWRIAGLPDPGEEAKAYLNDM